MDNAIALLGKIWPALVAAAIVLVAFAAVLGRMRGQRSDAAADAAEQDAISRSERARRAVARPLPPINPPPRPAVAENITVQDLDEARDDLPDFFADLEALFRQALAAKPHEVDTRLKLLEMCHAVGDADKFIAEAMIIRELVTPGADERWDAVVKLGSSLAPDHPLFGSPEDTGRGSTGRHYDRLDWDRLEPIMSELASRYELARTGDDRRNMLLRDLQDVLGRPSPMSLLWEAGKNEGAAIFLKRENDGAYQPILINAYAQLLMACRMNFTSVISVGRSAAHAYTVASVAQRLNLACSIVMDAKTSRWQPELLTELRDANANLIAVDADGDDAGADCRTVALRHLIENADDTMYISDLGGGPAPYARIIRDHQAIVGLELRRQLREFGCTMPDALVTSYEAGQAALGLVVPYLAEPECSIYCATVHSESRQSGPVGAGGPGVEMRAAREHSWLRASGRVEYREIFDDAVRSVIEESSELTDSDLTLENGRALALARDVAADLPASANVVVMLADSKRSFDYRDIILS